MKTSKRASYGLLAILRLIMLWLQTNKLVGQVLSRFHSARQRLDEMIEAFLGVGPRSSRGTGSGSGQEAHLYRPVSISMAASSNLSTLL